MYQLKGWCSKASPDPRVVFGSRPLCPGWWLGPAHNCFPLLPTGRVGGHAFAPELGEQTWAWTGNRIPYRQESGKEKRGLRRAQGDSLGRESPTSHLTNPEAGRDAVRELGEKEETLAMVEGEQKVASQVQPGTRAASRGMSGQEPSPVSPRWSPRRPQRLPPGSAPARSGRLVCPRPLLVFLFLVPGRASGSEEPGEAVPGGAAPPPAAGHFPGDAARPGLSSGRVRGVLRPQLGPGGSDSSWAEGVGQSTPGGRGAAPPTAVRWLLLPPPPARPREELEAAAPPPPPFAGAGGVARWSQGPGTAAGSVPPPMPAQDFGPKRIQTAAYLDLPSILTVYCITDLFSTSSQWAETVFRLFREVNELKFVKAPGKLQCQSALGCLAANKQLLKNSFHQGCKTWAHPRAKPPKWGWCLLRLSMSVNNSCLVHMAYVWSNFS